eukprot:CAMPEP_0117574568 /NCGR_PEP_ID=MMETSP0784-20121206/61666_1 /TAXON_ID=39447 /ORGANISM="" /LENGTH=404 /DNA_ID=CAMNT_0005373427 /DNA_START=11 /DNA_END=1225 /DNA_ORIENTATION=+
MIPCGTGLKRPVLEMDDASSKLHSMGSVQRPSPASLADADTATALKNQFPFYHTTAELHAALVDLTSTCSGANLTMWTTSQEEEYVSIDVVHVAGFGAAPINRVFLLGGEHARELIGPETLLLFLRALCGDVDAKVNTTVNLAELLADNEFQVVLNANPRSRQKVEMGDWCLRANPNGVDLNRNWDERWDKPMRLQTERGSKPFSEPETRILRRLVEDFVPTTFLSVHSGTLGMYMPWAWSSERLASRNEESMMRVLEALDRDHCRCPFGAAGKEVGYPCPGTSVDYVYDRLKTPYSFAFEIWGDPNEMTRLRSRWQDKITDGGLALLQTGAGLNHPHFKDVFQGSDFIQMSEDVSAKKSGDVCFGTFNPTTEELFSNTVANWAAVYMEMSAMIASDVKASAHI